MPGTSRAESYITAKLIGGMAPLHVACRRVAAGESLPRLVRKIVSDLRSCGILPRLVMADLEFCSAAVMRALDAAGIALLMPARRNTAIMRAIRERAAGRRLAVLTHTIRKDKPGSYTYRLLICNDRRRRGRPRDPADAYVAFATSRRCDVAPRSAMRTYSRRWGIETGYSNTNIVRPRTTSNDESARILLYFVALLSYNLWIIARSESLAAVTLAVFMRQLLREAEGRAQCGPRDPGGGPRDPGGT